MYHKDLIIIAMNFVFHIFLFVTKFSKTAKEKKRKKKNPNNLLVLKIGLVFSNKQINLFRRGGI